jgi:hypothetical protein
MRESSCSDEAEAVLFGDVFYLDYCGHLLVIKEKGERRKAKV